MTMNYQQQPYPYQPYQQTPPPPPKPRPAGFAVTSLVLGIVGTVLSFMPILNNITAAGAVVGVVFGMIGIWKSRIVMASIGTFLCGLAVILTIVAQQQLSDELDEVLDGDDPATPATAPVKPAAPTGPATSITSGMYQVGVDVQPGRYKTPGPAADDPMGLCYWARLKDDSGTFESIISNGNIEGPGSVTINKGEFLEITGGCTWTLAA